MTEGVGGIGVLTFSGHQLPDGRDLFFSPGITQIWCDLKWIQFEGAL